MIQLSKVLLRNAPEGLNTRLPSHGLFTSRGRNDESDAEAHNEFLPSILEQTGSVEGGYPRISGDLQVYLQCLHGKSRWYYQTSPVALLMCLLHSPQPYDQAMLC